LAKHNRCFLHGELDDHNRERAAEDKQCVSPQTAPAKFTGATGALFIGVKTIGNGFTYDAELAGEICLAL
jgi:hypothetical protein